MSKEAVEQELVKGNCLLLIDGLNEIRESSQTEAYQELIRFLKKYKKNSVLICCRTSAYEPRMLNDDEIKRRLRIYEIRRMGRDQIIDYVNRHFASDTASAKDLLSKLGIEESQVAHGGVIAAQRAGLDIGQAGSTPQFGLVLAAVRRALYQLTAWTKSRNEFVAVYAAKALWEFERGLAAETLKEQITSSNRQVVHLVKDVMEELGIE